MNGPDLHDPLSLPHTVTGYLIDSMTTVGGNGGAEHARPRAQVEVQSQASPPPWIWDTFISVSSSPFPVFKTLTVDNELPQGSHE